MFVLTQTSSTVVAFPPIIKIIESDSKDSWNLVGMFIDKQSGKKETYILGSYESEEHCKEVLEWLMLEYSSAKKVCKMP